MTEPNTVAVIITSHNYGQFVQECIESVRNQTVKASQIVVIADSCNFDDLTMPVAQINNIPCLVVSHKNCYLSRREGFNYTDSEFVIFLDADDILYPNYIEDCLAKFASNNKLGIVTTKLALFGTRTQVVDHAVVSLELERMNYIHAGSMVRRTALETTGAMDHTPVSHAAHEDWYIWRYVTRAGWQVASTHTPVYGYRQHPGSMMHSTIRHDSYYIRAALNLQKMTFVLPICRATYWSRLKKWIAENIFLDSRFNEMIIIDSADTDELRKELNHFCSIAPIANVIHCKRTPIPGLADKNRFFNKGAFLAVQKVMPKIYQHLRRATNEYIFILEDDVLPPAQNAVDDLLKHFDTDVAGVTATIPCRTRKAFAIAGKKIGEQLSLETQEGIEDVAFSGFGCLAIRRSAMMSAPPFGTSGTGNYDIEFWREVLQNNWRLLINWNVRCYHAEQYC